MEPPAKRPRLARDTCGDASQLTEASKSHRDSGQPSNSFQGYGVQNTGSFTAGKDFIINIDKQSNTSTGVDKYRVLLDSLRFEQMDAREWSVKKAHAQTCAWFLKTPTYLNWTHENALHNDHNFLWIKGKPGAGKSTLMKFLLGRLRNQIRRAKSQEVLLSFFFNARGHDLEKTTAGLYRSLLLQLLEARTDLQYVLDNVRIGHRWTTESLKTVFEEAVQGLGDASLICLIDALDECQEAQIREMVSFLSGPDILQNRVRICFASRHYPHVTVKTAVDIVLEEQGGHSEDIASYLNSALIIKDSPLAALICCEVQEKASGVFMWVVLVVDILNREYDAGRKHTLRQRIQQLPKDLHELFRNILTRDDNNMDGLLLCLQWVLLAQQPLTPKQLYFAIISGLEPDNLACCHSDDVSEDNIKRYILNNSKGLAESTKSKIPTVQFIHESVRDFLLKEDGLGQNRLNFSTNAIGQSHNTLKQCCLTYMNMEVMTNLEESTHDVITREFPFLEYANQGILYHAEQAQTHDVSQEDFLTTFPHSEWVKYHNILEKNNVRRYTSEVSLLYILAETDMSALIRAHSKRQSCFKVESERYGLPILAASATKSTAAIYTMLELEAERLSESSRLNLHSLMPPDLDIRYTSSRKFKFKEKSNLLCQLIEHGNEKVSLFFLATEQYDINAKCPQGKTILMLAAEKGFVVLVKVLLQMGADTLAADSFGRTPLHFASSGGHAEIAELLINGGANIATADRGGIKPLDLAATYGRTEVARLLINRGADILATTSEGCTPLHLAANYGSIEIAKLLIDCGADILATTSKGEMLLHIATSYGSTEIIELLIDCGADILATISNGDTPLHIATSYSSIEIIKLLINCGADVRATTSEGYTPLHIAAHYGRTEVARLLLDRGADILATTSEGYTPLHTAANHGSIEIIKLLIDCGADVRATTSEGYTPLHIAAHYGRTEVARLLLDRGADILATTSKGSTPLHIAASYNSTEIHKLLINCRAGRLAITSEGYTPLHIAANSDRIKIGKLLIDYSADVRATTSKRYTPLHYAANYGSIEIAKLLIDRGADILATNSKGDTPLHLASKSKNFKLAELLVSRGAYYLVAGKDRCTPLFRESVMP